jgi:hypothetical protein
LLRNFPALSMDVMSSLKKRAYASLSCRAIEALIALRASASVCVCADSARAKHGDTTAASARFITVNDVIELEGINFVVLPTVDGGLPILEPAA